MRQSIKLPPKEIRRLIAVLLVLGILLRFTNLDQKIYWYDETVTSSRIFGYTFVEQKQRFSGGYKADIEDLQHYQQFDPAKNVTDLVKGLAAEEPQLPPLYFLGVRSWVQWFGNSISIIRSYSAFISLFAFFGIYWLCQELFNSSSVSWLAVGLLAISPFHLLYAQEARPQSLWTVTILLASTALLRALRTRTTVSWIFYTIALALSLYTYVFSAFIAVSHAIYVIASEGFRFSKAVKASLLSILASFLCFLPWIMTVTINLKKVNGTTEWTSKDISLYALVKVWILNLSRIFFDLNQNFYSDKNWLLVYPIILVVAGLGLYSLYFLYRHAPTKTWLFIFSLIGVTALALALPDLIVGGRRSSVARYLIPCYLGVHLATAYLLTTQINFSKDFWRKTVWKGVTALLLSVGVLSCIASSQEVAWWNKYNALYLPEVAKIINQANHPIVISPGKPPVELSYLLKPEVHFQSPVTPIQSNASDVFMFSYNPAKKTLERLLKSEPNYYVEKTYTWEKMIDPAYEANLILRQFKARKP